MAFALFKRKFPSKSLSVTGDRSFAHFQIQLLNFLVLYSPPADRPGTGERPRHASIDSESYPWWPVNPFRFTDG